MKGYFTYDAYWARILGLALFSVRLLHDPLFDRRKGLPPLSDRTTTENVISPAGREIIVIRG
ncbi:hypothetical protein VB774_03975 [Pseudanabaena galeata UHCC 0370]|uniref:Uncharacterized protein n=1 Tax=Pseudanabaena galeata UHCC 0370 TaxID=3110310 RepID=A0ABU5TEU2_9CYAN|nr:hypothetical protein [Pseudanabaena galeata]MEA5476771.1 hypothetical protein [Pseudanabaena galeata UHCC 0370]